MDNLQHNAALVAAISATKSDHCHYCHAFGSCLQSVVRFKHLKNCSPYLYLPLVNKSHWLQALVQLNRLAPLNPDVTEPMFTLIEAHRELFFTYTTSVGKNGGRML